MKFGDFPGLVQFVLGAFSAAVGTIIAHVKTVKGTKDRAKRNEEMINQHEETLTGIEEAVERNADNVGHIQRSIYGDKYDEGDEGLVGDIRYIKDTLHRIEQQINRGGPNQ